MQIAEKPAKEKNGALTGTSVRRLVKLIIPLGSVWSQGDFCYILLYFAITITAAQKNGSVGKSSTFGIQLKKAMAIYRENSDYTLNKQNGIIMNKQQAHR